MRNSEFAKLILEERERANEAESKAKRLVQESARNDMYEYESYLNNKKSINERNESYYSKVKNLKESLLYECIMNLYNKSLGDSLYNGTNETIKQNLVTSFIKEQGVDRLINSFKTKNYLLSEYYRIINKCMDIMLESKKECAKSKDEENVLDIDDNYDSEFFDDLDTDDIDDVANGIKTRVSNAINEFITDNAKEQLELKDIISKTQEDIDAKAQENPDKDKNDIKESYEFVAKGKMNKLRTREKSIFESMVTNIADSSFKDSKLRDIYIESGSLDMDSIVENARTIYTFLEMINSTDMINVDESYIAEVVKSFKK